MDEKKLLPEKYYHTYYHHLLSVIEDKYLGLLSDKESYFIEQFKNLSTDAQCLYLRLQNRKGKYFRFSKFEYPEISCMQQRLQELIKKGFSEPVGSHEDVVEDILQLYTRGELLSLLEYFDFPKRGLSTLNKAAMVRYLAHNLPERELWQIFREEPIIKQNFVDEALMLQFLYFGSLDMNMSQFVIRDIGNLKFEEVDESRLTTTFENRKEAEDKLLLALAYRYFKELRKTEPPLDYFELLQTWLSNLTTLSLPAQPLLDRLIIRSGQFLEQARHLEEALLIYVKTKKAPARERRVRILKKLGHAKKAVNLCLEIINSPENAHEKYFAKDFIEKLDSGKRLLKSTTQFQKQAEVISIDQAWQYNVEMGVLDWFEQKGMQGFFAENFIWRALWGLLFWNIIFDEEHTGLHHPFQRGPDDLFSENFLLLRSEVIQDRLRLLQQPKKCKSYLKNTFRDKFGVANPIIGWFEELWPMLEYMVDKVPLFKLEKTLLTMCKNLKDNSKGFPDLLVWDEQDYCFVEVKSPNDTLSAQQLFWLEQFKEEGINAKLVNVKWE